MCRFTRRVSSLDLARPARPLAAPLTTAERVERECARLRSLYETNLFAVLESGLEVRSARVPPGFMRLRPLVG